MSDLFTEKHISPMFIAENVAPFVDEKYVYEMKWDDEVPVGVAIDQAVELAKKYSSDEGPSFVNGVLAKLAKA